MPTPAYMSIEGTKQGLITAGTFTEDSVGNIFTSSTGTQEHYFTIKLQNAIIVDVQSHMPNCQDPAQSHFTHLEDVYFTYRKIIWTHEVSGISGSDDWRTPISA